MDSLWMAGNYVRSAVASILQPKDCPYPKQRPSLEICEESQLSESKIIEQERLKAILFFKNWASEVSSHMKGGA